MFIIAKTLCGDTLSIIKTRGYLLCGANGNFPGFSLVKNKKWSGLDVDYCRALAVAIFNNEKKVKFIKVSNKKKFEDLINFKYDVLVRNTTWTFERDTSMSVKFAGVTYYDGQGFLILKDFGLNSALELNNAHICIADNSTGKRNVDYFFKKHNMKYKAILNTEDLSIIDFEKGRCDVITNDKSKLYSIKSTLKEPSAYKVLPETISKEPFGPVVRNHDDNWLDITKWVLFVLLEAEELNINKKNAFLFIDSKNPRIQKFLGLNDSIETMHGLDNGWSYNVISKIGNYKDIFDKNLINNMGLNIDRGLNALWNRGGIMYPLPIK